MDDSDSEFQQLLSVMREELLEAGFDESLDDTVLHYSGSKSAGSYTPGGISLSLAGASLVEHHVTHLHEVMHKALNEDTAWGAALQLAQVYEPWNDELTAMVSECRTVHESYATYMSVLLASSSFSSPEAVVGAYSRYAPLHALLIGMLQPVRGDHRKYFVATAIARVCMQAPILHVMEAGFPAAPTPSMLRLVDRPDARFAWLRRHGLGVIPGAVAEADRVLEDSFGVSLDDLDERAITDNDLLDEGWSVWEQVVFDRLAGLLIDAGATVLSPHEHLEGSARILARLQETGEDIYVRVARPDDPARSDLEDSVAALSMTRYRLRPELWRGVVGYVGPSIDTADVLELTRATSTPMGGRPELVIHARSARSVLDRYSWDERSAGRLASGGGSVVATRAVVNESESSDDLLVHHAVFRGRQDLDELLTMWDGSGPTALCVTTSTFRDPSFSAEWLSSLAAPVPMVVLLDIGLSALLGGADSLIPRGSLVYVREFGFGSDTFRAVQWHVGGQGHVGVFVGDSLGVQLVRDQFRQLPDVRTDEGDADWTPWDETVIAVVRSLLATESNLGFDSRY